MSTSGRNHARREPTAREQLHTLLLAWVEELARQSGPRLLAAIQFGSSAGDVLKSACDIDIMLVFETLPGPRSERIGRAVALEQDLDDRLAPLAALGHQHRASLHLRSAHEFARPSRLYWDMLTRRRVLCDTGIVDEQLRLTGHWLDRAGARRLERGLSWTWVFDRPELMDLRRWEDLPGDEPAG